MAVEQNDDLLNSIEDQPKDAYDAWAVLSSRLELLPEGARRYFEKLCAKIDEFDPHEDDELALTNHLETPVIRSKKRKVLGAKSPHNYAHIFDWVDNWQRAEDVNLDQALWDFIEFHDLDPERYETIKSAYHKVRRARLASMKQFDGDGLELAEHVLKQSLDVGR